MKQVDQLTNTQLNIQIMPHGTPDFGNKMDLMMASGSESIDTWPSVLDDWEKRGGDKILAQADDFYKNNKYLPSRRK